MVLTVSAIGLYPTMAQAATWEEMGEASTGELVSLDVDSVRSLRWQTVREFEFTYRIGPDIVAASIFCETGRISPDDYDYESFIPNKGSATYRMADRVCKIGRKGLAKPPKPPKKNQPTSNLPLQAGIYRVSSRHIQIANQGDRLCYRGATARGSTTASITPASDMPGFYRIAGWADTFLKQETTKTLLFGSKHQLSSYPADYEIRPVIDDVLQACLDSREDFHKQEISRR